MNDRNKDLEGTLEALKRVRELDKDFEKAIERVVEAELGIRPEDDIDGTVIFTVKKPGAPQL